LGFERNKIGREVNGKGVNEMGVSG